MKKKAALIWICMILQILLPITAQAADRSRAGESQELWVYERYFRNPDGTFTIAAAISGLDEQSDWEVLQMKVDGILIPEEQWVFEENWGETYRWIRVEDLELDGGDYLLEVELMDNAALETIRLEKRINCEEFLVNQECRYLAEKQYFAADAISYDLELSDIYAVTGEENSLTKLELTGADKQAAYTIDLTEDMQNTGLLISDPRYGMLSIAGGGDDNHGMMVYGTGLLGNIKISQDIPEGSYDLVLTDSDGNRHIFSDRCEVTSQPVVWDIRAAEQEDTALQFNNRGDYAAVYVLGVNLDPKTMYPEFYKEGGSAISSYAPSNNYQAAENGIVYCLRKSDYSAWKLESVGAAAGYRDLNARMAGPGAGQLKNVQDTYTMYLPAPSCYARTVNAEKKTIELYLTRDVFPVGATVETGIYDNTFYDDDIMIWGMDCMVEEKRGSLEKRSSILLELEDFFEEEEVPSSIELQLMIEGEVKAYHYLDTSLLEQEEMIKNIAVISERAVKPYTVTFHRIDEVAAVKSVVTQEPEYKLKPEDIAGLDPDETYRMCVQDGKGRQAASPKIGKIRAGQAGGKISAGQFTVDAIADTVYQRSPVTPAVTVRYGNQILTPNQDYKLSYVNNVSAGTAAVVITGIGNYEGSITRNFKILQKKVSQLTYSKVKDTVYTGKRKKPAVKVKDGKAVLNSKKEYSVSYGKNKAIGKGTATFIGKGNYTGKKTITFKINPRKMFQPSVRKTSGKTVKVSWKKQKGVTGYQIQYSVSRKFNKGNKTVRVKRAAVSSKTVKKPAKKSCYYRIRAYQKVGKTIYYGQYSKAGKVR